MGTRLFGLEERYIFVRHLQAPPISIEFPVEINGIVVRYLEESDLRNLLVRRSQPRDLVQPAEALVATRAGEVVGAVWYTSSVTAEQPWYEAVEPHLIRPARATANLFVVPGQKAAAWAIMKSTTDRLATIGVRTIVGVIASHNKPSILMSRLLGSRMVAQMWVRHRFGYSTTVVAGVGRDQDNGLTTSGKVVRRGQP